MVAHVSFSLEAQAEARLLKFSHESFVSNLSFKKRALGAIKRKAQLGALHGALYDEDDEEMEEEFGVSEDEEDVVLGIDVDVDDEDSLFSEIQSILLVLWHLKWELLVSFSPFVALLLAFAAFVVWNGSIVLGAKEAHTVSPHFAQLFIAHPYLLADNRHYPFYLWRKIINAHWSTRYLLVPLYVYSWASILNILAKVQEKVWVLAYFIASAAVLVPAPLIEFRYYTIPFFFITRSNKQTEDPTVKINENPKNGDGHKSFLEIGKSK
ncbi:hypothetical protein R6Q57_021248 [Mikania cordata]